MKSDKTREVAIKVVKAEALGATAKNEINTWKALAGKFNHPNILKIYTIYQSSSSMYIIMEYCNDGDLEGYLKKKKKITEDEATKVLQATISGLAYMNKYDIIHRDVKPANLIIAKGVYKICDYGLCKVIDKKTY
jgi:serine/threonine protein kinase